MQRPDDFVDPDIWPEGQQYVRNHELRQPGQMKKDVAARLWRSIHEIQNRDGNSGFRFTGVLKKNDVVQAEYPPFEPAAVGKKGKREARTKAIQLPPGLSNLGKKRTGEVGPGEQGPALPPRPTRKRKRRALPGKTKKKAKKSGSDKEEEAMESGAEESPGEEPELSDTSGPDVGDDAEKSLGDNELWRGEPSPFRNSRSPSPVRPEVRRSQPKPRPAHKTVADYVRMTAAMNIPPPSHDVEAAKYKKPNWVDDDSKVFPYLWALGAEPEYQHLLVSWRHLVSRLRTVVCCPILTCSSCSDVPTSNLSCQCPGRLGITSRCPAHTLFTGTPRDGTIS